MQGYNFTDPVRKALQEARESADRLGHGYVSPDHLLLGLAAESDGVAAAAVSALGVELTDVAKTLESRMEPGKGGFEGPDLPYTSRAKKVLELAMLEARELRHAYVGTEHLMLGLLREGKSLAVTVLGESDVTLEVLRAEVVRLLGTDEYAPDGQPPARADTSTARIALVIAIIALLAAITALAIVLKGRG